MAVEAALLVDPGFKFPDRFPQQTRCPPFRRGQGYGRLVGGRFGQALLLEYVFLEVVTVLLARRGCAEPA